MRRAVEGDRNAFADLYERHLGRVFRYFYYRTSQREDAEDLTEQVFLKAWQAMHGYEYRRLPFSAWIFRIAHNLIIDERRSRRECTGLEEAVEMEGCLPSPEEVAIKQVEARELANAIRQLSPMEQSIVALRFVEGLDHRTVASIIGKSEVATRSIQARALARLAETLGARERRRP